MSENDLSRLKMKNKTLSTEAKQIVFSCPSTSSSPQFFSIYMILAIWAMSFEKQNL